MVQQDSQQLEPMLLTQVTFHLQRNKVQTNKIMIIKAPMSEASNLQIRHYAQQQPDNLIKTQIFLAQKEIVKPFKNQQLHKRTPDKGKQILSREAMSLELMMLLQKKKMVQCMHQLLEKREIGKVVFLLSHNKTLLQERSSAELIMEELGFMVMPRDQTRGRRKRALLQQ